MSNVIRWSRRKAVIVGIMLLIAAAHVVGFGSYLRGEQRNLYNSYFSDLVLPFGFYFLMCLPGPETKLKRWQAKWAAVFLLPSIAETSQYFGIPVLGSTFDLLDYFMYAIGATSAAILETQVFSRIFKFWTGERVKG